MSRNPPSELLFSVHSFTLEQYHAMIEHGILTEEDKVELLAGKIIDMSPIGRFHSACVSELTYFFLPKWIGVYTCRAEQPISLPDASEPEPDFVIADFREDKYAEGHPLASNVRLLIEVSDKTLVLDRASKAEIYATAGIPEYWILNLIDRQLELYSSPNVATGTYEVSSVVGEYDDLDHPMTGKIPLTELLP